MVDPQKRNEEIIAQLNSCHRRFQKAFTEGNRYLAFSIIEMVYGPDEKVIEQMLSKHMYMYELKRESQPQIVKEKTRPKRRSKKPNVIIEKAFSPIEYSLQYAEKQARKYFIVHLPVIPIPKACFENMGYGLQSAN